VTLRRFYVLFVLEVGDRWTYRASPRIPMGLGRRSRPATASLTSASYRDTRAPAILNAAAVIAARP